jgi:Fe-S-cluster-containing hydrogenase component 2
MILEKVIFIEDNEDALKMCAGCKMCELICAFNHFKVGNIKKSRIKIIEFKDGAKVPVVCQHCNDAPCIKACPTGALSRKDKDSPVLVDEGRCIGCSTCVNVCPIGAITIEKKLGVSFKCDLCNGDPKCVKYCPSKVLKFGTDQQLSNLKKRKYAKMLKENYLKDTID